MERRKRSRITGILTAVLLAVCLLLPVSVMADNIDSTRRGSLTLTHLCGEKLLPDVSFSLYQIGSVREDGSFGEKTPAFASYPIRTDGLGEEELKELALTLAGYAQRDEITPDRTGKTDAEGRLSFTDLAPGYYLMTGEGFTDLEYHYTPSPILLRIPGSRDAEGIWQYDRSITTKTEKSPYFEEPLEERRVIKVWEGDEKYQILRPASIKVQLLKDGTIFDEVTLDESNQWRYDWSDLASDSQWMVVEAPPEPGSTARQYTVLVRQDETAFVITNTIKTVSYDPPVKKLVTGDTPASPGIFRFRIEAVSNTAELPVASMPMPEGTENGVKTMEIAGSGEKEFGEMVYAQAGDYVYRIVEENTGAAGYTYDKAEYILTVTVTEAGDHLEKSVDIKRITPSGGTANAAGSAGSANASDGSAANANAADSSGAGAAAESESSQTAAEGTGEAATVTEIVFTNIYDDDTPPPSTTAPPTTNPGKPSQKLPQTGQLNWPVPLLFAAGAVMLTIGIARRRRGYGG